MSASIFLLPTLTHIGARFASGNEDRARDAHQTAEHHGQPCVEASGPFHSPKVYGETGL
jgi:hypothetical protein